MDPRQRRHNHNNNNKVLPEYSFPQLTLSKTKKFACLPSYRCWQHIMICIIVSLITFMILIMIFASHHHLFPQQVHSPPQQPLIRLTLLEQIPYISTEHIWSSICKEGGNYIKVMNHSYYNNSKIRGKDTEEEEEDKMDDDNDPTLLLGMIEVGVHTARQCIEAASYGLYSHCIEPSKRSYLRILSQVQKQSHHIRRYITLYPYAASDVSDRQVSFGGDGSTGDHVVVESTNNSTTTNRSSITTTTNVTTIRIDDIILKDTIQRKEQYLAIKIDTQGYEPYVLYGMMHSIQEYAVSFVLMEFWPKGMDALSTFTNKKCHEMTYILQLLLQYNYTLYALPISYHPSSSEHGKVSIEEYIQNHIWKVLPKRTLKKKKDYYPNAIIQSISPLPTHDVYQYCLWFYQLEEQFTNYEMGYWSDILAVSPNVKDPTLSLYYQQQHQRQQEEEEQEEEDHSSINRASASIRSILQNPVTNVGIVLKNDLGIT